MKEVIRNFDAACNALAEAVNKQLFDGSREWYWIGGEIGGLCDFDSCNVIGVSDMRIIIEKNVGYGTYSEWLDGGLEYNSDKEPNMQRWINLEHWLMGARYDMFECERHKAE